ncbi:hypothetical protein [Erwinia persicina]|uniref:Uncharacterized protein n=2 Tax=Erwinia persicina TaxID=55211 RepID=A0A4U3EQX7_9GAMM|nr:hypothetical protein [Erwinia persicina]MBD8109327.1 hypothetical protein [Erwinia persicina]MBD8170215.1 hypothetical protein [Erwinia persicina]MBD8212475.1 hypothetical protein [Erwinia persicina]TKJ82891.1 hypothetical protein EpCFBP13511_23430 [Erwinia persicina]
MGRSIPVKIGDRQFPSKTEAVSYFMDQRDEVKAGGKIAGGEFFDELNVLFTLYCSSCPGWELNGRLVTHFAVKPEKRLVQGKWITTFCYEVHLSNAEVRPFSVDKAVSAIIKFKAGVV